MTVVRSRVNSTVVWLLGVQTTIAVLASGVSWVLAGTSGAVSAFLGGTIAVVVSAAFALKVFSVRPGASAAHVARAFILGEIYKLLLTAALFVVVLVMFEPSPLPLFVTYAMALMAYWLVLPLTSSESAVKTL